MASETIKLSAVESVRLTRDPATIRLELLLGGVAVLSRHIQPAAARRLGDALGFMSNDLAGEHPAAGGTCDNCAQVKGCHDAEPGARCGDWARVRLA